MTTTFATTPNPAYGRRLAALSLVMLLPSLGTSIANVALPTLASVFDAPFQDVRWVVIAYLLTVTSLIVGVGRLGDMFGRRHILLIGVAIFAAASSVCAFAPSLSVLVVARGAQGLGGAIMMSLTIASVGDIVPQDRTGRAMGLLGTVSAVGTALGPSLGGALIGWFGWQAVFALMTGAGLVAFLVGQRAFPVDAPVIRRPASFDFGGMVLLTATLSAYALSTTLESDFGMVNALLAGLSVGGLVAFVALERHLTNPLIHLNLLRDVNLSVSLISVALISTIVMATLVAGPFYLSGVHHLSPAQTGMMMSIGPAVSAIVGVPAGRLIDRVGAFAITVVGLIGALVGSILMSFLPLWFGVIGYLVSLVMITAGYALFQAANNTSVMATAPKEQRGMTSSLLGLSRNLGLITGASAMGALYSLGSRGLVLVGMEAGGDGGLQLTFLIATALAGVALIITIWSRLNK